MVLHAEFSGPFYVRDAQPGRYAVMLEIPRKHAQQVATDLSHLKARHMCIWLNKAHQAGYAAGLQDAGLVRKRRR